jgi:hypothetical protein
MPAPLAIRGQAPKTRAGKAFAGEMKVLHHQIKTVAICSPELFLANMVD